MPTEWYNLKNWFETEYTQKEQKFRRLISLNLKCDNGDDPNDKLLSLYALAETKRKRIQEIENSSKKIGDE